MKIPLIAAILILTFTGQAAFAAKPKGCTLVVTYPEGKKIKQEGDCTTRRSPASTFKIPLAVMGFDSGILQDATNPVWEYKPEYKGMAIQQKTTNPTIWLKESIVWYSQKLTRTMGIDQFQEYVNKFDYGNRDLNGELGKNNGLTQAWLFTSLLISPREQAAFIIKLLDKNLGVSPEAYEKVLEIMPEFEAGDWKIHGKTGSGWLDVDADPYDRSQPQGWFVGWAEKDGKIVVFAKLVFGTTPPEEAAGPKARDMFLKEFPAIMSK